MNEIDIQDAGHFHLVGFLKVSISVPASEIVNCVMTVTQTGSVSATWESDIVTVPPSFSIVFSNYTFLVADILVACAVNDVFKMFYKGSGALGGSTTVSSAYLALQKVDKAG